MSLRWGILGAAAIARGQVMPAIKATGSKIQAIASKSKNVDDLVEQYHIPEVHQSYEELLASNSIDAVYIPLPNTLHFHWVIKALQNDLHVLVEKPIVLDNEQMKQIQELAKQKGKVVMEAFMYRHHPQIEAVKQLIQNDTVGKIISMHSQFHFVLEDWENDIRITPSLGGGVLFDIGCYCLNIQQLILGEKVVDVKSITKKFNDVDVKVSAVLEYESGVTGLIDCSFYGQFTQTFTIVGTTGMIRLPYAFRSDINKHEGIIEVLKGSEVKSYSYHANAYEKQIENFERAVKGEQLIYTVEQMQRQVESLNFIYERL